VCTLYDLWCNIGLIRYQGLLGWWLLRSTLTRRILRRIYTMIIWKYFSESVTYEYMCDMWCTDVSVVWKCEDHRPFEGVRSRSFHPQKRISNGRPGHQNGVVKAFGGDWWRDFSIHAYNKSITELVDDMERYILYWRLIGNHFTHFYLFYNMLQESVTKSYVIITMIPAIRPYKDPTIVDHHPLDLNIWVFRYFLTELHDSYILYYIIRQKPPWKLTQYTSPFLMRIW